MKQKLLPLFLFLLLCHPNHPLAAPGGPVVVTPQAAAASFHEQEADRIEAALEAAPRGPAAYMNLIRLWEERSYHPDPGSFRERFARLAARPTWPPLLRSWARWYQAAADKRAGRLREARQTIQALGFPADWQVLGPFENHGGSGFDEALPPEVEAREGTPADSVYRGIEGDIRWRRLPELGALARIDLGPLFARSDEVLCYLVTGFSLQERTELALRLGSSDGLKVFVDGQLVHARNVRRQAQFDQEAVALRLAPGPHRLLVKVAHEKGDWSLFARFTRLDGSPIDGITFSAESSYFTGSSTHPSPTLTGKAVAEPLTEAANQVEALRKTSRPDPAELASRLGVLGFLHDRLGPDDERAARSAALFREAVALVPGDAGLRLRLGEALVGDENGRRAAYEQAAAAAPGWVPPLEALAEYHHGRADSYHAWHADEILLTADPKNIQGLRRRAERWAELDQPAFSLAELEQLHVTYPSQPSITAAVAEQLVQLGDRTRGLALYQQALTQDYLDSSLRGRVISLLEDRSDVEGVLHQLRLLIECWPHSLRHHLELARVLAENGQRARAIEHLRGLLVTFPDHARLHETLGRQLLLAGDRDAALQSLRMALQLRPQDTELRRYLRHLAPGEQTLEERFAVAADVLRGVARPAQAAELGAFRPLLLRAVRVHENGLRTSFTQLSLVVTDEQRLDTFRTVEIHYTPQEEALELLTAERISPTGEVHRPTRVTTSQPGGKQGGVYTDAATRVIQFSDLQAGDLLHVRFQADEVGHRNLFGTFFGDIINLQERIPLARLIYLVDAPRARPIYHGGRDVPPPVITEEGNRRLYRWELEAVAPLRYEPGMPGYPEVGRYLNVSTYQSWDALARWYAELIRPQLTLAAEDQALTARLVQGITEEREKVRAIHRWVVRNTRYVGIEFGIHGFKPYQASQVIRRGYGDCKDKASLLITMLGQVGIPAQLVLVRTLDRGRLLPDPPTLWGFNHAIAYIPSQELWLDGTAEFAGLDELPHLDQGAMALVVDPWSGQGVLREVPVAPASANHWVTQVEGEFTPDGALLFRVIEESRGQGATRLRRDYQDPATRRSRLEKMLASRFPGIQVLEASIEHLDSLDRPAAMRFTARLPHVLHREGDRLQLPVTLFPGKLAADFGSDSSRLYERVLDFPWSEEGLVTLQLPQGWRLPEPARFQLTSRFGSYELEIREHSPGKVVARNRFSMEQRRIPAADYPEFRRYLLELDQIEARWLPLQTTEQTAPRPSSLPTPAAPGGAR